jgi:acetyl esterase/lipase
MLLETAIRSVRSLLVALAVALFATTSFAQHSQAASLEAERVRAAIAAMGKTWNAGVLARTAQLYADLHRARPASGIRQMRDVSYGSHAQQKLDLYFPEQGFEELGPVFVFLHGGADTGGDKVLPGTDDLVYGNVAKLAARFGGVGINANYRQLPHARWPSGAEDIRRLIEWIRRNVAQRGGDPESIILVANGEGAMHLATYLFHQPSQLAVGPGIAGAVLASGTFEPGAESPLMRRYFGRRSAAHLPLNLVDSYQGKSVPIMLWSAELDPVQSGVAALKEKLCTKYGNCPMFVELAGHNHVSAVMSLDSPDTSAMNTLPRFYHSAVRK